MTADVRRHAAAWEPVPDDDLTRCPERRTAG